jgi:ATP-dependent exoDNAse (exonuclease V) beta subunit
VVILADIGCRLSQKEASRYLASDRSLCAMQLGGWAPVDLIEHNDEEAARDEAEGVRLAYVAATRARDLLVVPAVGDGPFSNGWVRPLNQALYPPIDRRQEPATAAGVPLFRGKDTVLVRPDGQMPDASTVRPGAYVIDPAGTGESFTVVWWDPMLLDTHAEDPRGLRRDDLIARDARPEDVAADRARYDAWTRRRADIQERGATPSLEVVTATEWARESVEAVAGPRRRGAADTLATGAVSIVDAGAAVSRPSGRRFGVLVHALLAAVPINATAHHIAELAVLHARVLGASDEEREQAAAAVERTIRHPLLDDARAALSAGHACRREAPISIMRDGTLIDGQVDLAFETAEGWTVVDFKTDAELGGGEDVYRRQVALYAEALASLTGRPARATILRV